MRAHWPGPLVIKGMLDPDDARAGGGQRAPTAIVVSNHGGRQLDGVVSTAAALPRIAEAVGGRMPSPGRRRGALGARRGADAGARRRFRAARPRLGLCAGRRRRRGVEQMLGLVEAEMRVAMALTGVTRVSEIDGDLDRPRLR